MSDLDAKIALQKQQAAELKAIVNIPLPEVSGWFHGIEMSSIYRIANYDNDDYSGRYGIRIYYAHNGFGGEKLVYLEHDEFSATDHDHNVKTLTDLVRDRDYLVSDLMKNIAYNRNRK